MTPLDRRQFLRLLALQAAAWSLSCGRHEGPGRASSPAFPPNPYAGRWMGDDFTTGHRIRDHLLPPLTGGDARDASDVVWSSRHQRTHRRARAGEAGRRVTVLDSRESAATRSPRTGAASSIDRAALLHQAPKRLAIASFTVSRRARSRSKVSHGEVFKQGRRRTASGPVPPLRRGGDATRQRGRHLSPDLRRTLPGDPWTRETRAGRAQFDAAIAPTSRATWPRSALPRSFA